MTYGIYYETADCPGEIWHFILQLVLAIGALYTLLTEDPRTAKGGDLTRSAFRSSAVGLKSIICVDSPSTEQLQVAAISVLYYLVSYHINRSLEQFPCVLTGWPSLIHDRFISIHLPQAIELPFTNPSTSIESLRFPGAGATMHSLSSIQPASSSPITMWTFFFRSLRLDSIIVETLQELYSSNIGSRTWAKVQKLVIDLDKKLYQWRHDLPARLLVWPPDSSPFLPVNQRMYLTLLFYGASLLLTNRPCFSETRQLSDAISSRSAASKRMDEDAANRCLSAAWNLIRLFHLNIHRPSLTQHVNSFVVCLALHCTGRHDFDNGIINRLFPPIVLRFPVVASLANNIHPRLSSVHKLEPSFEPCAC
ncbi:hypothetical protein PAAG_05469 [Paracoccidioides lutzii Pb01]|uniref:Transcription factor domain-containing protein n=1 Tax=Paracoccidioides lutzii (strain ATCC MYA-826 / Pb01) TaxID=502779 RepID=C1H3X6_PARBA|nr:hypothetical protein PAAG_05469 [Paracoccidioides lutzii Pb01]EEH34420.2 hypothetical protein PAAG_05469 [Paracoccidioides lutzii Pb01]